MKHPLCDHPCIHTGQFDAGCRCRKQASTEEMHRYNVTTRPDILLNALESLIEWNGQACSRAEQLEDLLGREKQTRILLTNRIIKLQGDINILNLRLVSKKWTTGE